ncbi:DNA-binding MarR family transcriptional regulator [Kitasatospora sp. MAA4]|uniref:MarR family winged helix-turn-helix transcriptional regulator n=1 Tax=Kitasatospora sp. MAA4 TaxID=3035093 RepID=UPI00247668F8|nr:MarR family transcriptional regulator [Kitasatospora sp. MAA4]MDH6137232.1 DNA-binding MarR family transcriptional regulator [Kitasatospora sp. MAA4]
MTSPSIDHTADHATDGGADGAAELADALTRAMKRIRRRTMDRLEPYGITPAQGRALRVLAHAQGHGTPGRAIRLSELAERLHIAPRSATTVVDALEQAGLVERVPDPADRRAVGLLLTADGHGAMERLAQVRQEVAEDYFSGTDPADLAVMLRVLRSVEAAQPAPSSRACRPTPAAAAPPAAAH